MAGLHLLLVKALFSMGELGNRVARQGMQGQLSGLRLASWGNGGCGAMQPKRPQQLPPLISETVTEQAGSEHLERPFC